MRSATNPFVFGERVRLWCRVGVASSSMPHRRLSVRLSSARRTRVGSGDRVPLVIRDMVNITAHPCAHSHANMHYFRPLATNTRSCTWPTEWQTQKNSGGGRRRWRRRVRHKRMQIRTHTHTHSAEVVAQVIIICVLVGSAVVACVRVDRCERGRGPDNRT